MISATHVKKRYRIYERSVEKIYESILNDIKIIIGIDNKYISTSLLTNLGEKLFGFKFSGVFTCDKIPTITDNKPYCILNLNKNKEYMSQCVAICKIPYSSCYLIYNTHNINTEMLPCVTETMNKINIKHISSTNCCQNILSFMYLFDNYGYIITTKLFSN